VAAARLIVGIAAVLSQLRLRQFAVPFARMNIERLAFMERTLRFECVRIRLVRDRRRAVQFDEVPRFAQHGTRAVLGDAQQLAILFDCTRRIAGSRERPREAARAVEAARKTLQRLLIRDHGVLRAPELEHEGAEMLQCRHRRRRRDRRFRRGAFNIDRLLHR
jgi:hypothetical protein